MGGFNNNPTCRQFKSSYKKIVTHVNSIVPDEANCTLQDDTLIFKSNSNDNADNSIDSSADLLSIVTFELYGWSWSEYSNEIVIYIAGFIVTTI